MKTLYSLVLLFFFTSLNFSQTIQLTSFASGLNSPVEIANTGVPGDTRLFVVEQAGRIKIINSDGSVNSTSFLDINVPVLSGGERGLLGLAFAPDYATSGRFYVHYSDDTDGSGDTVIARYTVSANPDIANTSETRLLKIGQPFGNHNGGKIAFGPNDDYLYISLGDGGNQGDPGDRAQNPNSLLGKILRIDVSGATYTIPPTNPYASGGGAPEVYAIGFRNGWKFSFDYDNADLWLADVGQNNYEEINRVSGSGTPGDNYGWRCYEGDDHFYANTSGGCPAFSSTVGPVGEYDHSSGRCSITGGYVYRGTTYPGFFGKYFFADFCSQEIGFLTDTGGSWSLTWQTPNITQSWSSFGEDINGELYAVGGSSVYKMSDASLSVTEEQISTFKLFPNPANQEFTIQFGANFSKVQSYTITNSLGQYIKNSNKITTENITISTEPFASGLYFIEILDNAGAKTIKKLIID